MLTLYLQYIYLRPEVIYSYKVLSGFPSSDINLTLGLTRKGISGIVTLNHRVEVCIKSVRGKAAVNVQTRVSAKDGAFIVQIHTDDNNLVERLPDIGAQGSREVMVPIPLMVPGESVKLTFWYGIPGKPDITPDTPEVKVRHSEGLGKKGEC